MENFFQKVSKEGEIRKKDIQCESNFPSKKIEHTCHLSIREPDAISSKKDKSFTPKYQINVHVRSVFLRKSQMKISHFFPAPQKLFLLIVFFNDFTSYRDSFFKRINRDNFCGAGKKWGIFICDILKKYGSYMHVYSIL